MRSHWAYSRARQPQQRAQQPRKPPGLFMCNLSLFNRLSFVAGVAINSVGVFAIGAQLCPTDMIAHPKTFDSALRTRPSRQRERAFVRRLSSASTGDLRRPSETAEKNPQTWRINTSKGLACLSHVTVAYQGLRPGWLILLQVEEGRSLPYLPIPVFQIAHESTKLIELIHTCLV